MHPFTVLLVLPTPLSPLHLPRYPQLMSWRPEARIPQALMGTIIENNFLGEKDEEHFPGYRWD